MDQCFGKIKVTVVKAKGLLRPTENNEATTVVASYYQARASTKPVGRSSSDVEWLSLPVVSIGDLKEYTEEWYKLGPKEMGEQISGEIMLSFKLDIESEAWAGAHKGAHAFLTGNTTPAQRLLQQALDELEPYKYDLFKLHAFLLLDSKQYADAIEYAQATIDGRSDDAEAFYYLGLAYYNLNDHASALKYFERGNQLDPKHPQLKYHKDLMVREAAKKQIGALVDEAVQVFVKKETGKALALLQKAQELNPNLPIWGLYNASVHLAARNWQSAAAAAVAVATTHSKWIKNNPPYAGELYKKGEINPSYKKRWCILKEDFYLYYYKNSTDQQPQGVILLYRAVVTVKGKEIILKREFKLRANTDAEAKKFSDIVTPLAKKPLRIPRDKDLEVRFPNTPENTEAVGRSMIRARIKDKVQKARDTRRERKNGGSIPLSSIIIEGNAGFLKPGKFGNWEKAYIVATTNTILKFNAKPNRDDKAGVLTEAPQDQIPLLGTGVIEVTDQRLGISLEITHERETRIIRFSSVEEKDEWKSAVNRAINELNSGSVQLSTPGSTSALMQHSAPNEVESERSRRESRVLLLSEDEPDMSSLPSISPLSGNLDITPIRTTAQEVVVGKRAPGIEDRYFRQLGFAPPKPTRPVAPNALDDIRIEFKDVLEVRSDSEYDVLPDIRFQEKERLILNHDPYLGNHEDDEESCCEGCTIL